jgi:hypothetical protein
MEEAIRAAVADLKPDEVITPERLARQLGLDQNEVGVWLDLLAAEGRLIRENRVLSEIRPDAEQVVWYRVPPYG